MIAHFGKEMIYQDRAISILADYGAFKDFPSARFIIREIISNGSLRDFVESDSVSKERIIQNTIINYGFEAQNVRNVFEAFNTANEKPIPRSANKPKIVVEYPTDIIFLLDASKDSYICRDSMNFVLSEIFNGLNKKIRYRVMHYNDISLWDVKDPVILTSRNTIRVTYSFCGNNILGQALHSLTNCNFKWADQKLCPIIIWFVGSNPSDNFKQTLDNLINEEILFNRSHRIAVSFGGNVNSAYLKQFAGTNHFSSIDIDEIIKAIDSCCGHSLVNPIIEYKSLTLLQKKIHQQEIEAQSPEMLISDKLERFKDGIFACKKNGKWGWMGFNGEQFIPYQYSAVMNFSDGLAATTLDGTPKSKLKAGWRIWAHPNWGFINILGQEVIKGNFIDVINFKIGISFVEKGNMYGVINRSGNIIVPIEYAHISYASEDILIVCKEIDGYKKYGYIKITGEKITECIYDSASSIFNDKYFIVSLGKCSYLLNPKGRRLSILQYPTAEYIGIESLLKFRTSNWDYGMCLLDGIEKIPGKYKKIEHNGCMILASGKGFIDLFTLTGDKINQFKLNKGFFNVGDTAIVQKEDKKWYILDLKGKLKMLPYSNIYYVFKNGNILADDNNPKYDSLINIAVYTSTGLKYGKGLMLGTKCEEYEVEYKEYQQYIKITQKVIKSKHLVLDPYTYWFNISNGVLLNRAYSDARDYSIHVHGLYAIVSLYHKETKGYGINAFNYEMNIRNNYRREPTIIPAYTKYWLINFDTGKPISIYIDADGKTRRREFDGLGIMSENRIWFKEKDKFGYLDQEGNIVIEAKFDSASNFNDGYAIVGVDKLKYIINLKGEIVTSGYEDISYIQKNIYGGM